MLDSQARLKGRQPKPHQSNLDVFQQIKHYKGNSVPISITAVGSTRTCKVVYACHGSSTLQSNGELGRGSGRVRNQQPHVVIVFVFSSLNHAVLYAVWQHCYTAPFRNEACFSTQTPCKMCQQIDTRHRCSCSCVCYFVGSNEVSALLHHARTPMYYTWVHIPSSRPQFFPNTRANKDERTRGDRDDSCKE